MLDPSEGRRLYEGERSTSERHLRARFVARRRPRGLVHRPAPLRRGLPDRRRRPRRRASRKLGVEPLSRRVHAGGAGGDGGRAHGAAEVVPARPVRGRRGRQHLRRRGALPGPPAPALAGRLDEARAPARRCATPSSPRWRPGSTAAAPRSTTTATAAARRGRCRTSSSSTPARASPARAATATIVRIVVAGRSTYFCPSCQVRLRNAAPRATPSGPSFNVGRRGRKDASRRRRSSCAASATARPTASSTSTRRRGAGSARSPRGRANRNRASAAAWSRSSGST